MALLAFFEVPSLLPSASFCSAEKERTGQNRSSRPTAFPLSPIPPFTAFFLLWSLVFWSCTWETPKFQTPNNPNWPNCFRYLPNDVTSWNERWHPGYLPCFSPSSSFRWTVVSGNQNIASNALSISLHESHLVHFQFSYQHGSHCTCSTASTRLLEASNQQLHCDPRTEKIAASFKGKIQRSVALAV